MGRCRAALHRKRARKKEWESGGQTDQRHTVERAEANGKRGWVLKSKQTEALLLLLLLFALLAGCVRAPIGAHGRRNMARVQDYFSLSNFTPKHRVVPDARVAGSACLQMPQQRGFGSNLFFSVTSFLCVGANRPALSYYAANALTLHIATCSF